MENGGGVGFDAEIAGGFTMEGESLGVGGRGGDYALDNSMGGGVGDFKKEEEDELYGGGFNSNDTFEEMLLNQ